LINTLDTLLEKRPFEYVLVELNGLADPMALIRTFWVDDGLGSLVTLHQTITLVDSKSFASKLTSSDIVTRLESMKVEGDSEFPESELLVRQLVYADKVILNKTDLVQDQEIIQDIKRVIAKVNP
jgi:G3E family GTPase